MDEFGQLLGRMDLPIQLSAFLFYLEIIMLCLGDA